MMRLFAENIRTRAKSVNCLRVLSFFLSLFLFACELLWLSDQIENREREKNGKNFACHVFSVWTHFFRIVCDQVKPHLDAFWCLMVFYLFRCVSIYNRIWWVFGRFVKAMNLNLLNDGQRRNIDKKELLASHTWHRSHEIRVKSIDMRRRKRRRKWIRLNRTHNDKSSIHF